MACHPSHLDEAISFRLAFNQPLDLPSNDPRLDLQLGLIEEEFNEFEASTCVEDPQEDQLKELADLVFTCYQYAAAAGWELDVALTRVFDSNMSKLCQFTGLPLRRADGKILKGPNYTPPTLTDLL